MAKTRETVSEINPAHSEQPTVLNLGNRVDQGNFGDVFVDIIHGDLHTNNILWNAVIMKIKKW